MLTVNVNFSDKEGEIMREAKSFTPNSWHDHLCFWAEAHVLITRIKTREEVKE